MHNIDIIKRLLDCGEYDENFCGWTIAYAYADKIIGISEADELADRIGIRWQSWYTKMKECKKRDRRCETHGGSLSECMSIGLCARP